MRFRALNLWKKKVERQVWDKQFVDLALMFNGVKYGWGKENLKEVDCSGLISAVLNFMGFPIRTTADEFLKRFFTQKTDWNYDPSTLKAVFFVAKTNYSTPSGDRLAGFARHVGVLVGDGIIINAVEPYTKLEILGEVKKRYNSSTCIIRELDWEAVEADNGKYAFDPDLQ